MSLLVSTGKTGEEDDENHDETLTASQRERHDHMWSTIGLCGSAFSMFYFIMNVFPYSGFFALHLLNNENSSDGDGPRFTAATIGPYAGTMAAAFRLGRVGTAVPWGKCADVYGRKFVLVVGCASNAICGLMFAFATSFRVAVAARCIAGLLCGTMVAARTAVSEIPKGNSELEKKGIALLSTMSGYGKLITTLYSR